VIKNIACSAASKVSVATEKEIAMSIRNILFATAFAFASLGAAHADGLHPIGAKSINLGEVSGVAYYTIERDGLHVVTTLAQGEAGTPIRWFLFFHRTSVWFFRHRIKRMRSKSAGKATALSSAR
jgi:hypothetical protein